MAKPIPGVGAPPQVSIRPSYRPPPRRYPGFLCFVIQTQKQSCCSNPALTIPCQSHDVCRFPELLGNLFKMHPAIITDMIQKNRRLFKMLPAAFILTIKNTHGIAVYALLTGFAHIPDFVSQNPSASGCKPPGIRGSQCCSG